MEEFLVNNIQMFTDNFNFDVLYDDITNKLNFQREATTFSELYKVP